MTSTTETTELNLTRDALTLVMVSPAYYRSGEQNGTWSDTGEASRTFYATASRAMGDQWALIITGPEDSRGGWGLSEEERSSLGLSAGHKGWNIPRRYLTPVNETPTPETPTPDPDAPLAVGDSVRVNDDHPAPGWRGITGTVTEVPGYGTIIVRADERPDDGNYHVPIGSTGGFNPDSLTRITPDAAVGAPETGATGEGGTFTQEDVDRLVSEAREAAKREADRFLEEFKRSANARAVEYAEANGLCSEFERCMEDIGLLGRDEWHEENDREYDVVVTLTYSTTVQAPDADVARDRFYDDPDAYLPSYVSDLSVDEVDVS